MCQGEQPDLNQVAEEFQGRVAFIGVSNDDTVEDGRRYQEEFGVPYPLAHAPEVWELFDDPFRPTTIVLDENGEIAHRIDGPVTADALRAAIKGTL